MMYWYILVVILAAILDWMALGKRWQHARVVTKPLVIVLLLIWFYAMTGFQGNAAFFAAALFFSLIGDIWLMMPAGFFLFGLAAFFVAHCAYIIAFAPTLPQSPLMYYVLALALALVGVIYVSQIRVGIMRTRGARRLRVLSGLYCFILTIMMVAAIATTDRPEWNLYYAIQVSIGGMLFFLSDSMLAYDRFVNPIRHGRLLVRISYHLGQILIISGAALQLVSAT